MMMMMKMMMKMMMMMMTTMVKTMTMKGGFLNLMQDALGVQILINYISAINGSICILVS
jgi:hypothetical protein